MIFNYLVILISGLIFLFFATVVYVSVLKIVANIFSGVFKTLLTLLLYLVYCLALTAPLFFLIGNAKAGSDTGEITWVNLILIFVLYLIIIAPSLFYFLVKKAKDLKETGYIE